MRIQVSREGTVLGEHEKDEVLALLKAGVFRPSDFYWREGMAEWLPLTDLVLPAKRMTAPTSRSVGSKWVAIILVVAVVGVVAWAVSHRTAKRPSPYALLKSSVPADYLVTIDNMSEVTKWAEEGDAVAQALLAEVYRSEEIEQDYNKSFEWAKKSSAADCALGTHILGVLHSNGLGVKQDESEAKRLFTRASEELHRIAPSGPPVWKIVAARAWLYGRGVIKDEARGVAELKMLAESGVKEAMMDLGICYLNGTGVAASKDEFASWFERGAQAGSKSCMSYYAFWMADPENPRANRAAAIELLEKLVDAPTVIFERVAESAENHVPPLDDAVLEAKWIERAAKRNIPKYMESWAVRLYSGAGVAKDKIAANMWRERAAKAGYNVAMLNAGSALYFDDKATDANLQKAIEWLTKFVGVVDGTDKTAGSRAAFVAEILNNDDSPHHAYQEAARFYRIAIRLGEAKPLVDLAWLYYQNKIGKNSATSQSVTTSSSLLIEELADSDTGKVAFGLAYKAASHGIDSAYHLLGSLCIEGKGCAKSADEALRWWSKWFEADATAKSERIMNVVYYWEGNSLSDPFPAQGFRLLELGAGTGDVECMRVIGFRYSHGQGVAKDLKAGYEWTLKAAETGSDVAMFDLGLMFSDGEGVLKDDKAAVKWWRKAAELGRPNAMHNLGASYAEGTGVPRDYVEAYAWLNLATANGVKMDVDGNAKQTPRDRIAGFMTRDQIAEAQQRSREYSEAIEKRKQAKAQPKSGATDSLPSSSVTGTGFFVSNEGHFITNAHVIDKATTIKVRLPNHTTVNAHVIRKDAANDLAVLQLDDDSAKTTGLVLRAIGEESGAPALTVGFPNVTVQGMEPKVTEGSVSSASGIQDDPRFYQISVPIQPGNSGGPLLNQKGEVIGIVQSRLSTRAALASGAGLPQNVNYALKASLALPLLDGIPVVNGTATNANSLQSAAAIAKKSVVLIMAQ